MFLMAPVLHEGTITSIEEPSSNASTAMDHSCPVYDGILDTDREHYYLRYKAHCSLLLYHIMFPAS